MPTLPFEPEAIESLKSRVPAALDDVVDSVEITTGKCLRPGQQRKYVFDAPDGLRIIVSREKIEESIILHASCSAFPDTPVIKSLRGDNLILELTKRVQDLLGFAQSPKQVMTTNGGVVHFAFDDSIKDSSPRICAVIPS